MTDFSLPDGAYLGWRYVDARSRIDRRQLYHDDGRVEAIEGDERFELCRFTPEQVAAAKVAIGESGLTSSSDTGLGETHDAAPVTYAWRLESGEGSVTNAGHPATSHEAIDRLDRALAELEEAAGCWPLMADEAARSGLP